MSAKIFTVDLPWPYSWDQMQWQIAAWLARHDERATIEVCWNETLLAKQVDAALFQSVTTDFYRALQQRLNGACQWKFEQLGTSSGHRLILGLCGRVDT